MKKTIMSLFFIFYSSVALSWGGRGHDHICQAATHLVKNEELREFLQARGPMMGHLCNIPDTYWRSIPEGKPGSPTHYFEPEVLGKSFSETDTDYKKLVELSKKTGNLKSGKPFFDLHSEMGSLWWRAEQFFNLAVTAGADAKKEFKKSKKNQKFVDTDPYYQDIYQMTVMMGLLGHFVADASMPYHGTVDYDGWEKGRGGIHRFYEETVVGVLDPDLLSKIVAHAKNTKMPFSKEKGVLKNMKAMSEFSYNDLEKIEKADEILKPSQISETKGIKNKIPAQRVSPVEAAKKFEPLIINQMAYSAALLAQLWDQIYEKSGQPNLKAYDSYKFPFTPDFVPTNYLQ